MAPYHRRELAKLVGEALGSLPVVVVTGLRQSGKTTFLRRDSLFQGRRFYSLDDFATREAARREPESLIRGEEPVIVDEAQRSPELLMAVKRAVDERRVVGQYLLSGSANFALLEKVSESLAGRALYLDLHPFTRRERTGRIGDPPLLQRLLDGKTPLDDLLLGDGSGAAEEPVTEEEVLDGGMPPIVLGEAANRSLWLLGYEQTYLERDLRDLSQVADLGTFRHLLQLVALRTGQILNQSELARETQLSVATVSRYLNLLETSFVVVRVRPHLRSRTSRLIKSPKVFVTDSALAAHLVGVEELGATAGEPLRGPLFETFVRQNLAGILSAHLPGAKITFWSVQGRHEVDFVVTSGRRSVAVEVKAGTRFGRRDLAGLRACLETTPDVGAGLLAYNGTETVALGDNLYALPLARLLS